MGDKDETILDANTASGSSPGADANSEAASSALQTDANAAPSAEGAETDAQRDAAILERVEANQGDRSEPPPDETGKPPVKPGAKEEPAGAKPAEKTPEQQAAEDAKLPFNKHPRWQEMTAQKEELRKENEALKASVKSWNESVEWMQERNISPDEHKSVLQSYAEIRQANVSPEDFAETMKWRALVNTNPQQAIEYAEKWMEQLKVYAGQVLPKDLQDAVNRGEITEAWARKYAETQFAERRAKGTLDSTTQLNEQQQAKLVGETVGAWVTAKFTQDPELQASKGDPNGLLAAIHRRMSSEEQAFFAKNKRGLTPAEASALLESCYQSEKGYVGKFVQRPPARKAPLRNGSSTIRDLPENPTEEQTDENILDQVASRHGGSM